MLRAFALVALLQLATWRGAAAAMELGEPLSRPLASRGEAALDQVAPGDSESFEVLQEDPWSFYGMPRRSLLHQVHDASRLVRCPRCTVRRSGGQGHCKSGGKRFRCRRTRGNSKTRAVPNAIADSIISQATCPNLHNSARLRFTDDSNVTVAAAADVEVLGEDVFDYENDSPQFQAVGTPEELQEALRLGVYHILITEHLDMRAVRAEPDLDLVEALNNAVGRVKNTTLSITGCCDEPPPEFFNLTEPVPGGACAILVREDFLDAPRGTSCLLLDSLYVAMAQPGSTGSSVLLLHVDGMIWITNSVFQGAGGRSRAIDANTINNGTPELFIGDTTFTGFTRNYAPGIRALRNSTVWLDNVTFRSIVKTTDPRSAPEFLAIPEIPPATAVAAYPDALLVIVNVTIAGNEVLGEPAGVQAISVSANRTTDTVYANPRLEVWQWPGGPATSSDPNLEIAADIIRRTARPQLEVLQDVQLDIARRELRLQKRTLNKSPDACAIVLEPPEESET